MQIDHINALLTHWLLIGIDYAVLVEAHVWPYTGLALGAGLMLVIGGLAKRNRLHIYAGLTVGGAALIIGPVLWVLVPIATTNLLGQAYWVPAAHKAVFAVGTLVGIVATLLWWRYATPSLANAGQRFTRRSQLERNRRTDVRQIGNMLPRPRADYDPTRYFRTKDIFIGHDECGRPIRVPRSVWVSSHVDVVGTTGAGKGAAATMLLAQALIQGEAVIVFDPKHDEYAPHVLRNTALKAGVPFHFINLNPQYGPQLNLLAGAESHHVEEMLIAGFGLSDKGEGADHYRRKDRKLSRALYGRSGLQAHSETFASLYRLLAQDGQYEDAEGFFDQLEELADLPSINAKSGIDLAQVIREGGCIYLVGSMRNARVIAAQRILLIRLIQLAEQRDRSAALRPIAIFLDELKHHISRPALESLAAARDKGMHLILAHQSLADLRDCPRDLNPDAVVGAIVENTKIKIAYRIQDPETAEWLARMSGTILVDDEFRKVARNTALAETIDGERQLRAAERYFIDINMLLNLPFRCAALYGVELPRFTFICPVPTKKSDLAPTIYAGHDPNEVKDKGVVESMIDVD